MSSKTLNRPKRRSRIFVACTMALVVVSLADTAIAGIAIDKAVWKAKKHLLVVKGTAEKSPPAPPVTVFNANDPDQLIGVDNRIGKKQRWTVRARRPDPVPCSVRAEQGGMSVVMDVANAPPDCSPTAPPPPPPPPDIGLDNPQTDFKILMNYELGMHCTGFEFAYCCVLPVYNSILAQVVKPESSSGTFPRLLEGDPIEGLDALGRETVVRDKAMDGNGNFKKYVLKYWHDAQPRNDGNGKVQTSTRISATEGNSLLAWNTPFDSAALNPDGSFVLSGGANPLYNGAEGVVLGDGVIDPNDPADNYQNAVWNHLYFYEDLEGSNSTGTSLETDKIRLGVNGHVVYPPDCGAALHPLGPVTQGGDVNNPAVPNDCGGFSNGNVLTFSGDKGTVVYTQMKVLENLPVMLTSPDIWEALGLPLTPFEDSIDFFGDPGLVDEDSVRPFVAMKAQMYDYDPNAPGGAGAATLDSNGNPVIGFGTAPIDIPNCERCHSNPEDGTQIPNSDAEGGGMLTVVNSPNNDWAQYELVRAEYEFWNAYYGIDPAMGDSDWYSRLKSAAVSMLKMHDTQHGTSFAANYPGCGILGDPTDTTGCGSLPQSTRMGHEAVICQRCHADNVIAVVKSATHDGGELIPSITEAIHDNHRGVSMQDANGEFGSIVFADSLGRDGSCQGCHPAHRSSGIMAGYPLTLAGANRYAGSDNRDASGGCFVGRDVHSNPGKDTDGAETPEHLNAVGQWLQANVSRDSGGNWDGGIWCTNCHNQLGQEMWKNENVHSLVHGTGICSDGMTACQVDGDCNGSDTCALNNPRGESTLAAVAAAVGTTEPQAIAWLDPTDGNTLGDFSYAVWLEDPGLCQFLVDPTNPAHDGNVATVEVALPGQACSTGDSFGPVDCSADGGPVFNLCGTYDGDGDFSVNAMDFCTTDDCVAAAQATLSNSTAVAVPMSAATDGRDHWLAPGEPHCADCHAAPYVEQSGNINPYPPFNYPRKASLMRYSKGHRNISCQGCHESIHGLYPVTPNIDTTTYAQAAALNADGSHGPIQCAACHDVNADGVPNVVCQPGVEQGKCEGDAQGLAFNGTTIVNDLDAATSWAHGFTAEADLLNGQGSHSPMCRNCHADESSEIAEGNREWLVHAMEDRVTRKMMDEIEVAQIGHVAGSAGADSLNTLCTSCHHNNNNYLTLGKVSCGLEVWKTHLIGGFVNDAVWEQVSKDETGSTCGW